MIMGTQDGEYNNAEDPFGGADDPEVEGELRWALLPNQVLNVKGCFPRGSGETAANALFDSWHQDAIAEPLPTLFGVVDRNDCVRSANLQHLYCPSNWRHFMSALLASHPCFVLQHPSDAPRIAGDEPTQRSNR